MKTLQFLIDSHWVDIITRASTDEGMKRIYERARKEEPSDSVLRPSGMRLITIHEEHLGALPKVTLKITKREIGPLARRTEDYACEYPKCGQPATHYSELAGHSELGGQFFCQKHSLPVD